ncbi:MULTISPECIES: GtrA family protein [Yersinia]|uniref:GtrA family protein n=1 Tax=Yersinia bercovieri TaxID=634 RepID=A0A2G4U2H1_YERBE|nr:MULTISPECIES: GtrA family protein [Yersinia]MDN0102339.1 GtrA family protein [Yersinia bercovieri]PHZ27507.1 GtrA family protein [Yersinia bercovieri]QDW33068.1 GtrA family protein [Yersinia sp. KBS0713]QKJ08586.1 GtrA family protein [Yersinia bercovieri ATCC 43970]CNF39979.1 GtrA-like protein [Yersinia bercovieri]
MQKTEKACPRISALLEVKLVRFLLVGVMNAAFGYGCFAAFLYLGLHYSMALLLATILGVLFNFKSIGALVFGSKKNSLIFRFVAGYIVVYGANVAGIAALTSLGATPYLAGIALIVPMALLSFVINNRYIFNHA